MKITTENSGLMVIKNKNYAALAIGAFFILFALMVIFNPMAIKIDSSVSPIVAGAVMATIGLLLIFFISTTTVTLDKSINKALVVHKSLVRTKTNEYDFKEIKTIEIEQIYHPGKNRKRRGGYSYQLQFILEDETKVPLTLTGGGLGIMGQQAPWLKQVGSKIASFLGIELLERRAPTVGETLSTIKEAVQEQMGKNE